jgi:hypothetical protein
MEFCPACGVNARNGIFYASRVVRNPDNSVQLDDECKAVRVFDVPFTPTIQNSRICQYAKVPGCINTCKAVDPTQTFEARSGGSNVDSWLEAARDLLKHD